jgi:hypothetical protein
MYSPTDKLLNFYEQQLCHCFMYFLKLNCSQISFQEFLQITTLPFLQHGLAIQTSRAQQFANPQYATRYNWSFFFFLFFFLREEKKKKN